MRLVLLLAAVLVAVWVWRTGRQPKPPRAGPSVTPNVAPDRLQDMRQCAVCELHLPLTEAVIGKSGAVYCSTQHRHNAET